VKSLAVVISFFGLTFCNHSIAYEINNHADMSQIAAGRSVLNDTSTNGKLFRLGLKPFLLGAPEQTFPILYSRIAASAPLETCFGQFADYFGNLQPMTLEQQAAALSPTPVVGAVAGGYTAMTIAQLVLLQGVSDLFFAELACLHGMRSFLSIENSHRKFCN
jgi:hypothetical protein